MDVNVASDDLIPPLLKILAFNGLAVPSSRLSERPDQTLESEAGVIQFIQETLSEVANDVRPRMVSSDELSTSGGPYLVLVAQSQEVAVVTAIKSDGTLVFEGSGGEFSEPLERHQNDLFIAFDVEAREQYERC